MSHMDRPLMPKWEIAGDRPRLNFQQVRRIVVNAGSILKRHAKFEGPPSKCVEVVCFSDSVTRFFWPQLCFSSFAFHK